MTGILDETNIAHMLHKIDKVSDEVLRDYFAASAMQGVLSTWDDMCEDELAKKAYIIADAMMRRKQTNQSKEEKP